MTSRNDIRKEIIGTIVLGFMLLLFAVCVWQMGSDVDSPTQDTYTLTSIASTPNDARTDMLLAPVYTNSLADQYTTNSISSYDMHMSVSSPSIAVFTHRTSDAKVQHISGGTHFGNSNTAATNTPTQNSIFTSSSTVWSGTVLSVASNELAFVGAASGDLPEGMFTPTIRRAPPDEEDEGTNGPNIDNQPLGDGSIFLIILAIAYIYIQYKHSKIVNYKNTSI